jgi:hypothetical protein
MLPARVRKAGASCLVTSTVHTPYF